MPLFKKHVSPDFQTLTNFTEATVKVKEGQTKTVITLDYKDYLYSQVKEDLKNIKTYLGSLKTKHLFQLTVHLDDKQTVMTSNVDYDNPLTLVDMVEVVKARVPSAKHLRVSLDSITFDMGSTTTAAKSVAIIGNLLEDHFSGELKLPFKIKATIAGLVSFKYTFKLVQKDIVNETVVNSYRYLEMMDFLLVNPHPDVSEFMFDFRDTNKGMFTEMNAEFNKELTPREEHNAVMFIREKLSEAYSHLGIY